jgi:uncharacterized protein
MLPVVTPDPMGVAALPTPDAYAWCTSTAEKMAPAWRNEVTLLSMEFLRGYEPGRWVPLVAPTPLLMIVSPFDRLADGQLASEAYQAALPPKKLVLVPGGHFDVYTDDAFDTTSGSARDWFAEHLLTGK